MVLAAHADWLDRLRNDGAIGIIYIDFISLYREGGAEALRPKPRGRPRKEAAPATREEELEREVRRLEAQVAYLKKSIALKAQRRSQTGTKP